MVIYSCHISARLHDWDRENLKIYQTFQNHWTRHFKYLRWPEEITISLTLNLGQTRSRQGQAREFVICDFFYGLWMTQGYQLEHGGLPHGGGGT